MKNTQEKKSSEISSLSHQNYMHRHNASCPSDPTWRHGSGTWIQVMVCCLISPSQCLNRCWLITSEVVWLSEIFQIAMFDMSLNITKLVENKCTKWATIEDARVHPSCQTSRGESVAKPETPLVKYVNLIWRWSAVKNSIHRLIRKSKDRNNLNIMGWIESIWGKHGLITQMSFKSLRMCWV